MAKNYTAADKALLAECLNDEELMADIQDRVGSGESPTSIAYNVKLPHRIINTLISSMTKPTGSTVHDADLPEIQGEAELQARRAQKFQDKNRISNKTFREGARYYNAVEELAAETRDLLGSYEFSTPRHHKSKRKNPAPIGIIQLADLHLNEVVELFDTIGTNSYTYRVASQRLQKFADQAIKRFLANGIKSVLIASTGDLLNSDRRLDELLSNAGNRSKALVVSVDLLQQFIREIAEHFDVTVLSICGNESRKDDDVGSTNATFSNNYDYDIHMMLWAMFDQNKCPSVQFMPVCDAFEAYVQVAGHGILFIHGHQYDAGGKLDDKVAKDVARYARAGKVVDYVIFGHVHATRIGDFFARSGSLVGANAYSNHKLRVSSLASQNIYVVDEVQGVFPTAVPLQETAGYEGYDYPEHLITNTGMRKSVEKAAERKTIFKLVI